MSIIFLSETANNKLKEYLRSKGHSLCEIKKTSAVYNAISSHPDIYICKLRDELVVSKDQLPNIENHLIKSGVKYMVSASTLGYEYPENIKYNAVQIGRHFIHNTKYTDHILLSLAKSKGLNFIHVNQGYTKCNLVVIDDHSVITSDLGIAKSLKSNHIEVLMVSNGHVSLPGFNYGFLGGASGRVGNEIIFNGDLPAHPDYPAIKNFILGCGIEIKYFEEYELGDMGSIIEIQALTTV